MDKMEISKSEAQLILSWFEVITRTYEDDQIEDCEKKLDKRLTEFIGKGD